MDHFLIWRWYISEISTAYRSDAPNILILSVARAYKNDLGASSNATNAVSRLRVSVNEVLLEACFTLI
jgi:hypothetical protein